MMRGRAVRNGSNRGFSLIELLVTVAIISILAGLLLPALARGKAASRAAVCRSNLRQAHLSLSMYVSEFGVYPPATAAFGLVSELGGFEMHPLAWWLALAAYNKVPARIFECPEQVRINPPTLSEALSGAGTIQFGASKTIFGSIQYSYNSAGTGERGSRPNLGLGDSMNEPVHEAAVKMPSDMIAFGDGEAKSFGFVLSPINSNDSPAARHNAKANVAFCDGHIEAKKPAQWTAKDEATRSRWNNDHLPHF